MEKDREEISPFYGYQWVTGNWASSCPQDSRDTPEAGKGVSTSFEGVDDGLP
jgi:hypothetical protein